MEIEGHIIVYDAETHRLEVAVVLNPEQKIALVNAFLHSGADPHGADAHMEPVPCTITFDDTPEQEAPHG